jgi:hypothetical protein
MRDDRSPPRREQKISRTRNSDSLIAQGNSEDENESLSNWRIRVGENSETLSAFHVLRNTLFPELQQTEGVSINDLVMQGLFSPEG